MQAANSFNPPCPCRNRLAGLPRRRDKADDDPANDTIMKAA
jgi:hypothetical protein